MATDCRPSPWSQPPRTFAECNFRLASERRKTVQPGNLPQGPWRPPSRQTKLRTPTAASLRSSPRPPSRPRTTCTKAAPQSEPPTYGIDVPSRSPRAHLWAAGLTTRESAEVRTVAYADLHESNRRVIPSAPLRRSAEQKQEDQTRQIGKQLREIIAARRSVSGKQMASTIVNGFEALDHDGSGIVSSEAFAQAMLRLGMGLRPKQMEQLLDILDVGGNGSVNVAEFISIITESRDERPAVPSRPCRRRHVRMRPAAAALTAKKLRCAATEVLLGHAAIDACRERWRPSSALRAINFADVGAGAALAAAVQRQL